MDLNDKTFDRIKFTPGSKIFEIGEKGLAAYVVLQGEVEIGGTNDKGESVTYTTVKRGEMFGELALMQPDAKRTATATTKFGCEVMTISRDIVVDKIDRSDIFIKYWIKYLTDRVVDLSKRVAK
jgi:CRP/FNR family transcriptional regulator, cyclic AMP receptor protein